MTEATMFRDLPPSAYPFDIYAYPEWSEVDRSPVWHYRIDGPGCIHIPGTAETGQRVRLVFKWGDGTESRVSPEIQE